MKLKAVRVEQPKNNNFIYLSRWEVLNMISRSYKMKSLQHISKEHLIQSHFISKFYNLGI